MIASKNWILLLALAATTALGGQKREENLLFFDNKDDFKLYADRKTSGLSFSTDTGLSFDLRGKPVVGVSRLQSLEFSSARAVGEAADSGEGSFKLVTARLTGDVTVTIEGESNDGSSVTKIEMQTLDFNEGEIAKLTFPSKFKFENTLKTGEFVRTVTVTGSSGTFGMLPLDQAADTTDPVLSADVRGPIQVVMFTDIVDPEKTDQRVTVTGDRLTYSNKTRVLRIEGNVKAVSTQLKPNVEPFSVTIRPQAVEVDLDKDWQVVLVRMVDGPGTLQVTGGGGR